MSYAVSVSFTNEEFKRILDYVGNDIDRIAPDCKAAYLEKIGSGQSVTDEKQEVEK